MVKISKFESLLGTNLWESWYGILGRHRLWLISPTKFWIYAIVCVCSVWSAHKWGWTLSQWVVVDLVVGVADWNFCAPYVQSCEFERGARVATSTLNSMAPYFSQYGHWRFTFFSLLISLVHAWWQPASSCVYTRRLLCVSWMNSSTVCFLHGKLHYLLQNLLWGWK